MLHGQWNFSLTPVQPACGDVNRLMWKSLLVNFIDLVNKWFDIMNSYTIKLPEYKRLKQLHYVVEVMTKINNSL